jgi:hypothetical protein
MEVETEVRRLIREEEQKIAELERLQKEAEDAMDEEDVVWVDPTPAADVPRARASEVIDLTVEEGEPGPISLMARGNIEVIDLLTPPEEIPVVGGTQVPTQTTQATQLSPSQLLFTTQFEHALFDYMAFDE